MTVLIEALCAETLLFEYDRKSFSTGRDSLNQACRLFAWIRGNSRKSGHTSRGIASLFFDQNSLHLMYRIEILKHVCSWDRKRIGPSLCKVQGNKRKASLRAGLSVGRDIQPRNPFS